jgi:small subunit ribosomal protein S5
MARDKEQGKDNQESQFIEKTVKISRVAKVVKGGRRFSFSALVVSGDGKGKVGFGLGKAAEVPEAIRKATEQARRSMVSIPMVDTTIPHTVVGCFGPTKVLLKPASGGTGVIAGAAARAIVEAIGIHDIRTKCIGSNNPHNILHATLEGLKQLRSPEAVSAMRGLSLDEMEYQPY